MDDSPLRNLIPGMNEVALFGFKNRAILLEAIIGTRVRSLREFFKIPKGTEGVIDQVYKIGQRYGVMVAWDLPDRPLPTWPPHPNYDGMPPMRDGFGEDETHFLEVIDR
jgi:hypothetical protein